MASKVGGTGVASVFGDPFFERERSRLNRILQNVLGGGSTEGEPKTAAYPVDVHEDDDAITVEAELPGFKRDELDIGIESGVLTIKAERRPPTREGTSHLSERRFTRVQRSFTLPSNVDEDRIDARLEDGVLYIVLPKQETSRRRRIDVK